MSRKSQLTMPGLQVTYIWLALIFPLPGCHGLYDVSTLHLNSQQDCNHDQPFQVTKTNVYKVESDEESESNSSSVKNCTMTFKKESSANRSICMVYIPHRRPDCGFDWTLLVLRQRNSLGPSDILYGLVCGTDQRIDRPHAWCAPYDLDQITLVHKRQVGKYVWSNESVAEQPEMYRFVVTDFPGNDTDQVLDYTQKWLALEAKEEDSGGGGDGGGGGGGDGGDVDGLSGGSVDGVSGGDNLSGGGGDGDEVSGGGNFSGGDDDGVSGGGNFSGGDGDGVSGGGNLNVVGGDGVSGGGNLSGGGDGVSGGGNLSGGGGGGDYDVSGGGGVERGGGFARGDYGGGGGSERGGGVGRGEHHHAGELKISYDRSAAGWTRGRYGDRAEKAFMLAIVLPVVIMGTAGIVITAIFCYLKSETIKAMQLNRPTRRVAPSEHSGEQEEEEERNVDPVVS